jgi:hypothetical protein
MPFQDQLVGLNRRLEKEKRELNHMYLEAVEPWSDSRRPKSTSTVVDVKAMHFLGAVGARLVATVVEINDDGPGEVVPLSLVPR